MWLPGEDFESCSRRTASVTIGHIPRECERLLGDLPAIVTHENRYAPIEQAKSGQVGGAAHLSFSMSALAEADPPAPQIPLASPLNFLIALCSSVGSAETAASRKREAARRSPDRVGRRPVSNPWHMDRFHGGAPALIRNSSRSHGGATGRASSSKCLPTSEARRSRLRAGSPADASRPRFVRCPRPSMGKPRPARLQNRSGSALSGELKIGLSQSRKSIAPGDPTIRG